MDGWLDGGRLGRRVDDRQRHEERRSFPLGALDPHPTEVAVDDLAGDVQPEPQPAERPGWCIAPAEVPLEHKGELIHRNADALVAYAHDGIVSAILQRDPNR